MKNKKRNVLSFKTKAEIILVTLLLIGIAISSVWGTTTITDVSITTDSSDLIISFSESWIKAGNLTVENLSLGETEILNWNLAHTWIGDRIFNASKAATIDNDMMLGWNASNVTLIRNNNGNSWAATGANIQVALDDLSNGGTVWLPSREILTISSEIDMPEETILDGQGCVLKPDASFDMINMSNASTVRNINFDVTGVTYLNSVIMFWGGRYIVYRENITAVENCVFNSVSQQGTAINFTDGEADDNQRAGLAWIRVNNIYTRDFNKGIHIVSYNTDETALLGTFFNGNMFTNLFGYDDRDFIYIDNTEDDGTAYSATETGGNIFSNIMYQPDGHCNNVIYVEGKANIFSDVVIWDWAGKGAVYGSVYSIYLSEKTRSTMVSGTYGISATYNPSANAYDYTNIIFSYINLTLARLTFTDYSSGGINYASSFGVQFYKDTGTNPSTYWYGDVAGNDKYGAFNIDSSGNWDFITEIGHITFDPVAGKFVGINTTNPAYELDVTGDIHCTGKLTSDGGNDPPYVLFNKETFFSVLNRIYREVPQDNDSKWDGQAIYYDGEEDNMFMLNPKTGNLREFVWKSDYDALEERITRIEIFMRLPLK